MVNTGKIKGRMTELGLTQAQLSQQMGISQTTISQKIRGQRPMTVDEAETLCGILNISDSDFATYFFTGKIA